MSNQVSGKTVEAAFFTTPVVTTADRTRITKIIKNVEQGNLDGFKNSEWSITFKDAPITYLLPDKFLTSSQSEYLSHMLTVRRTKK